MANALNPEYAKAFIEYLRFITTLSTGSLVLLITFLEKIFSRPKWKGFVVVSLIGFTESVIASVLVQIFLVKSLQSSDPLADWEIAAATFGLIGTWLGFLIGITCLAAFAVRNLSALPQKED